MYNPQEIANKIKAIAKSKGILVKDLLLACELNVNTLNQISSKGGISAISIAKIADYLSCSVDYLLGRADESDTFSVNVSDNKQNNINGNNTISVSVKREDESRQLLEMIETLDLVERSKIIVMINDLNELKKKDIVQKMV